MPPGGFATKRAEDEAAVSFIVKGSGTRALSKKTEWVISKRLGT